MQTIRHLLDLSVPYLEKKLDHSARLDTELLLAHTLQVSRLDLYMDLDRPLVDSEVDAFRERVRRRAAREPLQYIVGTVDFLGLELEVTSAVLIPRPETEFLADMVIKELQGQALEGKVLWDLCCGSGCLGLAIKKQLPELTVILSDLSREALLVAERNAERHGLEVVFKEGDFLNAMEGEVDYIVSNPPYIAPDEYATLQKEVRDYEPRMALVAENEGLAFYNTLLSQGPSKLRSGGKVWLELGKGQDGVVYKNSLTKEWRQQSIHCDLQGVKRFFSLERE